MQEKEIKSIIKGYYKHLSFITFETIKGFSKNFDVTKNIIIKNYEIIDFLYKNYNSVIGVLGHYGNWEWAGLAAGKMLNFKTIIFYKPLSNKVIDKYLIKLRSKTGCKLVSIYETNKVFEKYYLQKSFFVMVADQSPSNLKKVVWVNFLNKNTPCIYGPEFYAIKYNLPIIYVRIYRLTKGKYQISFDIISLEPQKEKPHYITQKFFQLLENDIIKDPSQWLWSHKRWKHLKN